MFCCAQGPPNPARSGVVFGNPRDADLAPKLRERILKDGFQIGLVQPCASSRRRREFDQARFRVPIVVDNPRLDWISEADCRAGVKATGKPEFPRDE